MWRDRTAIAAIVGSGLHASILAPGKRIVAVSDSPAIISSFALIDRINNANARYLGIIEGGLIHLPRDPAFSEVTYLTNPIETAEAILRSLDAGVAHGAAL